MTHDALLWADFGALFVPPKSDYWDTATASFLGTQDDVTLCSA